MIEANFRTKSWSILPTFLSLDVFIHSRKCQIKHSYLTYFYLSLLPLRFLSQISQVKRRRCIQSMGQKSTFCLGELGSCYIQRGAERSGVQWVNHGAMQMLVFYFSPLTSRLEPSHQLEIQLLVAYYPDTQETPLFNQKKNAACSPNVSSPVWSCGCVVVARIKLQVRFTVSSVAGSSAPEGDQGLTFDTDQRSAFSYTMFSNMSVRERGNGGKKKKKAFILGDVLSFRWFCTQRPLDYEVCNVSFENVLVALEHAQRSVLDLMQGYSFLCDIGAKA